MPSTLRYGDAEVEGGRRAMQKGLASHLSFQLFLSIQHFLSRFHAAVGTQLNPILLVLVPEDT